MDGDDADESRCERVWLVAQEVDSEAAFKFAGHGRSFLAAIIASAII